MTFLRVFTLPMAMLALQACTTVPAEVDVGRTAFVEQCSSCHGATGRGDGTLAVLVNTGVPDLRQLSARNGGGFPRAYVIEAVTGINASHADIVAMPDFKGLFGVPDTVFTTPDGDNIKTHSTILAIADYLETVQD